MTESADLVRLRAECVRSFSHYFREARRTCKLLTSFATFPISLDQRLALVKQRQREIYAYQSYRYARGKFLEMVSDAESAVPLSMPVDSSLDAIPTFR